MKKFFTGFLCAFVIFAAVFAVYFIIIRDSDTESASVIDASGYHNAELLNAALTAVEYISERDYSALSEIAHPEYGVVFSSYSNVNLSSDQCFTCSEIAAFEGDTSTYVWGTYDGSGNPIEMTVSEYFDFFVYNANYIAAPVLGINYIVKYGNALENVSEVFPDGQFVDFNFPSLSGDSTGSDWSTLRLVFEEYDGELKLTAIIHCEMTV